MSHPATPHEIFEILRDLNQVDEEDRRSAGAPTEPRRQLRRTLLERLPVEIARQYDRLLQAGRRPAVVTSTGGHCQACHMLVPPQIVLILTRAELVCRCPSCHRFLCPPAPGRAEPTPDA